MNVFQQKSCPSENADSTKLIHSDMFDGKLSKCFIAVKLFHFNLIGLLWFDVPETKFRDFGSAVIFLSFDFLFQFKNYFC